MTDRKPPENATEFLDRLTELLASVPDRSLEELREDLRARGIDPERVVERVERLVQSKLNEYRLRWQEQARRERLAMLERLRDVTAKLPAPQPELEGRLAEIVSGLWGPRAEAYAQAYFRKLDQVTENDLRSLLEDLERLKLFEGLPDQEGKDA